MKKPTVVDLFSGAGGLSLGFEKAGFDIVLGTDFNENMGETFIANHKRSKFLLGDIKEISTDMMREEIGKKAKKIDLVIGGPPCQGFSTHGKRVADDPRNRLFLEFVRVVNELKPKFFVMENVPGLLYMKKGEIKDAIVNAFDDIGYETEPERLCAADYGVPQMRYRVFFIGHKKNGPQRIGPPQATHAPYETLTNLPRHRTVRDAIGDLPKLENGSGKDELAYRKKKLNEYVTILRKGMKENKLYNHRCFKVSDSEFKLISHIPSGGSWRDIPLKELPKRFQKIKRSDATQLFGRLVWNKPSYTITTNFATPSSGANTHPNQNRSLSVREAARLQSFPDWFVFKGGFASQKVQVGNAVPPLLAKAVASEIIKYC